MLFLNTVSVVIESIMNLPILLHLINYDLMSGSSSGAKLQHTVTFLLFMFSILEAILHL